jgi:hypothetical protein
VLPAESRNPEIVGWNSLSGLSQFNVDSRIVMRGPLGNIQYGTIRDQIVQPMPKPSPMTGLSDTKAILPNLCGQGRYVAFGPDDRTLGRKYGLFAEVARLRISIGRDTARKFGCCEPSGGSDRYADVIALTQLARPTNLQFWNQSVNAESLLERVWNL